MSKMNADFMKQIGQQEPDKQSSASKRRTQVSIPQKGGLAYMTLPANRTGTKPGGNSQDPVQPLPVGQSGPHLSIVTSNDVHVLRAIATSTVKVLYDPALMDRLRASGRLLGIEKPESDDLVNTMLLRLGVFTYSQVAEAVTLGVYSGCLKKSGLVGAGNILDSPTAEVAAVNLNNILHELLDVNMPYDVFELTLDDDAVGFLDVIKSDRAQANLANVLLRAIKPDSATRAETNDSARARAKMGQFQVQATLPAIAKITAQALHAGFSHAVAYRGYELIWSLRVVEAKGSGMEKSIAANTLSLLYKAGDYGFRFAMTFIVKQCPKVMEHPAMAEASAAIAEFLEGYAKAAALPESLGDSGYYSFMKGRVSATLMSYTELGRRAKTLYGLCYIIQTEFFEADSQSSWAGFATAHKTVSTDLLTELYAIWESSAR